jgi:putative membrane protein
MNIEPVPENILRLERPHRALWTYYIITSIFTGPGIVAALPYLFFRYHTLRYRREVNLTYARIQDIHLRSGILQRWLGLANVQVQTASGSAGPELVIEGFKEYELIRDFLYTRMRGYQTHAAPGRVAENTPGSAPLPASSAVPVSASSAETETVALLLSIRDELRRTRELLEARGAVSRQPPPPPSHV